MGLIDEQLGEARILITRLHERLAEKNERIAKLQARLLETELTCSATVARMQKQLVLFERTLEKIAEGEHPEEHELVAAEALAWSEDDRESFR